MLICAMLLKRTKKLTVAPGSSSNVPKLNGKTTESMSPAVGRQSDEVTKFDMESLMGNPAKLVERGAEECSPLIQSSGKSDDAEAEVLISSNHCEPADVKCNANNKLQLVSLDSSSSAPKKPSNVACCLFDEFVTNILLDLEKMSVSEIYTRYFVRPEGACFASSAVSHSNIQATCSASDAKLPRTSAIPRVMKCNSEGTDGISPRIRSTDPLQSATKGLGGEIRKRGRPRRLLPLARNEAPVGNTTSPRCQQTAAAPNGSKDFSALVTVTLDDDFGSLVNHILKGTENLSAKQMYDRYLSPITCENNDKVEIDEKANVVAPKKRPVDAVTTSDKAIKVNPGGTTNIQVASKNSHPAEVIKQKPLNITIEKTSDTPMGTWVECVKCGKWRFLSNVHDPSIIPEAWHCGLQMKYSTVSSNDPCAEPQPFLDDDLEKGKYVYTKFTVGSVVWAKLNGYPEWPAMIDCDSTGRYADYDEQTGEVIRYFVVFLDPKTPTRQRIQAAKIRKFISIAEVKHVRTWARYYTRLLLAAREAENALALPLEERIFKYGYPYPEESSKEPRLKRQTSVPVAFTLTSENKQTRIRRRASDVKGQPQNQPCLADEGQKKSCKNQVTRAANEPNNLVNPTSASVSRTVGLKRSTKMPLVLAKGNNPNNSNNDETVAANIGCDYRRANYEDDKSDHSEKDKASLNHKTNFQESQIDTQHDSPSPSVTSTLECQKRGYVTSSEQMPGLPIDPYLKTASLTCSLKNIHSPVPLEE